MDSFRVWQGYIINTSTYSVTNAFISNDINNIFSAVYSPLNNQCYIGTYVEINGVSKYGIYSVDLNSGNLEANIIIPIIGYPSNYNLYIAPKP